MKLSLYKGVYKNKVDKSTFVFKIIANKLFLAINKNKNLELKKIGEHEFQSVEGNTSVQFVINHAGVPHSVVVKTPKKEYLAHRVKVLLPSMRFSDTKAFIIVFGLPLAWLIYFFGSGYIEGTKESDVQQLKNAVAHDEYRSSLREKRKKMLREKIVNRLDTECSISDESCLNYIKRNYFNERENIEKITKFLDKKCDPQNSPEACRVKAEILMDSGNIDESLNLYNKLCNFKDALSCKVLGMRFFKEKKYNQSKSFLEKACGHSSCEELARLYLFMGNFDLGLDHYRKLCNREEDPNLCRKMRETEDFISNRKKCEQTKSSWVCLEAASFAFFYGHKDLYTSYLNWVCSNNDFDKTKGKGKLCRFIQ